MTQVQALASLKRLGWWRTETLGEGSFGIAIKAIYGHMDSLSMSTMLCAQPPALAASAC